MKKVFLPVFFFVLLNISTILVIDVVAFYWTTTIFLNVLLD